jgi:hypothetical protein
VPSHSAEEPSISQVDAGNSSSSFREARHFNRATKQSDVMLLAGIKVR